MFLAGIHSLAQQQPEAWIPAKNMPE